MTFDLFPDTDAPPPGAPLAERLRPRTLDEVVGQPHLMGTGRLFGALGPGERLPSLIFWGPPGTGKTTLARLLARAVDAELIALSAVTAGVKQVREAVDQAGRSARSGRRTVLFLDEIHRFNKAQQDALLPHVESGRFTLLGATTENPSFEVNAALLSRCRVVTLRALEEADLTTLASRALADPERGLPSPPACPPDVMAALVQAADGDARRLLNTLETAAMLAARTDAKAGATLTLDHLREALQSAALRYDRTDAHFDQISALQKSVRASDAQASAYWCTRMLAAGEDPLTIARRLVRIAVEDVGLADPDALGRVMAAQAAVHFLGRPEGDAALVQAALYLALAPKSNRVTVAESRIKEAIERTGSLPVPLVFRNAPTRLMKELGYGKGYRYEHDSPAGFTGQRGLPDGLAGAVFYEPTDRGFESVLAERLQRLERAAKAGEDAGEGEPREPGDSSSRP